MEPILLDTHSLIWLLSGQPLSAVALRAIFSAQAGRSLHLSPITAWEAGVASLKKNQKKRPDLLGLSPDAWMRHGLNTLSAKLATISQRVAIETSKVPAIYGSADPGDCFLIATARVRNLILITRDDKILALARRNPSYLKVIAC